MGKSIGRRSVVHFFRAFTLTSVMSEKRLKLTTRQQEQNDSLPFEQEILECLSGAGCSEIFHKVKANTNAIVPKVFINDGLK